MRVNWITAVGPTRNEDGGITSHLASVRYRVICPALQLAEHAHRIVPITQETTSQAAMAAAEDADVLVFSKMSQLVSEPVAERAKALGAAVVLDLCDNYYLHPQLSGLYRKMTRLADRVVCNTPAMAEVIREETGVEALVIHDPFEGPERAPRFAPDATLKALWFGSPANFDSLAAAMPDLVDYSRGRPLDVVVLSQTAPPYVDFIERLKAGLPSSLKLDLATWSLEAQAAALERCDVVLLPSLPTPDKIVRSSNRMVQALRAGRPAVAHPLASYLEFAAWTPVVERLSEGLRRLEDEAAEVPARIAAAQGHIERRYAPGVVADQWRRMLADLA